MGFEAIFEAELLDRLKGLNEVERVLEKNYGARKAQTMIQSQQQKLVTEFHDQAILEARRFSLEIFRMLQQDQSIDHKAIREILYQLLLEKARSVDQNQQHRYTKDHINRVSSYSQRLAQRFTERHPQPEYEGYEAERFVRGIAKVSKLHDIGKACLPYELVNSNRK